MKETLGQEAFHVHKNNHNHKPKNHNRVRGRVGRVVQLTLRLCFVLYMILFIVMILHVNRDSNSKNGAALEDLLTSFASPSSSSSSSSLLSSSKWQQEIPKHKRLSARAIAMRTKARMKQEQVEEEGLQVQTNTHQHSHPQPHSHLHSHSHRRRRRTEKKLGHDYVYDQYRHYQLYDDQEQPKYVTRQQLQLQLQRQKDHLFHGRVLNELCRRVLSRSVTQSNVLVVSPDISNEEIIPAIQPELNHHRRHPIITSNEGDGPSTTVVSYSVEEYHATYMLPSSTNLNQWWNEDDDNSHNSASWYLLSYFIPGNGKYGMNGNTNKIDNDRESMDIDTMLHPSRVNELLGSATLTYIVFQIHSHQKSDGTYRLSGLTAVQTLLDANYKVQLLASTHLDGDAPYRPNYSFQSQEEVKDFLMTGAKVAKRGYVVVDKDGNSSSGGTETNTGTDTDYLFQFDALLFATQGLDLAIPSRLSYLTLENFLACNNASGRCDSKLNSRALDQDVFMSCPKRHNDVYISFDPSSSGGVQMISKKRGVLKYNEVELWMGHDILDEAEAICMRTDRDESLINPEESGSKKAVACSTRIIPKTKFLNKNMREAATARKLEGALSSLSRGKVGKVNVISILIDPISRNQFKRSLPNTSALLEKLGFIHFEKYTVVGDNSGPNQSALFSGAQLIGGREGIKSSDSHGNDSDSSPLWLWDQLGEMGYVTLKAEDICIQNSNMVQSLKPKTTHGEQLYQMFCFDFDRPNCLGRDMAAQHLITYTEQFINAYGRPGGVRSSSSQPWAAFISFVDSHEDTVTLISYLDEMLVKFLQTLDLSNTAVIFSSDHGLHYGPSFESNGERERAEPILYMHLPPTRNNDLMSSLKTNREMWVTPFDVHETILDVSLGIGRKHDRIGKSLLHPLSRDRMECHQTPGIPERFCSLLSPKEMKEKQCTIMAEPPSIHSFYSDILKTNRPSWPKCKRQEPSVNLDTEECLCSTNIYPVKINEYWIPCNSTRFEEIDAIREEKSDPLRMKSCKVKDSSEYTMDINITISPHQPFLEESRRSRFNVAGKGRYQLAPMPNILFIEIDSLSRSGATRHLPKTMSLLQSHQIRKTEENGVDCPTDFCAAIFNKTSIIGQNSIPNQLAALSGCTSHELADVDSYLRPPARDPIPKGLEAWCPKSSIENPWFYKIVRDLGYITLFGEEFCYSSSPYVIQNILFRLNPHYNLNQLWCQLTEADKTHTKADPNLPLFSVEHDRPSDPQPCIDGRSRQEFAFEYIRGMWNSYSSSPKFAYLSSISAHDYSTDLAYQSLGIEAYDEHLSNFLEEMLQRPDAKNTVIILRSDHGLQGGPSPIDFSTQVEHMNPFNTMIVPKQFRGFKLDELFANQDKLVTGYDLYNTMRNIVRPYLKSGNPVKGSQHTAGIPSWSYNLLSDQVPDDRTCEDAKIPVDFCPCLEERTDLMPYYYVGHAEKLDQMETVNLTALSDGRYIADELPGKRTIKFAKKVSSEGGKVSK